MTTRKITMSFLVLMCLLFVPEEIKGADTLNSQKTLRDVLNENNIEQTVLYGWPLKAFDNGTLVYQNSMVHFAPTHSAQISIYNPHTKVDRKIYPAKTYSKIRTDHILKVKAAYDKLGNDWFRCNNHHMDPELFNNYLISEVAIDNDKRSLSFFIGYDNKDFGSEGTTKVLHVYENIDAKKIKCMETLNTKNNKTKTPDNFISSRGKSEAIANSFAQVIGKCNYSFLSEKQIAGLRREIRDFAEQYLNGRMNDTEFKTVIAAIENYGMRRVRSKNSGMEQYSLEMGCFEFRDQVNTFKWLLWKALTRGSLSADEVKQRNTQHNWLRKFIKTAPIRPGDWRPDGVEHDEMRQWAEDTLEQKFADPLSLMSEAMTDEQFVNFKAWMKSSAKNGLVGAISDIRCRALGAHAHKHCEIKDVYRYPFNIELPFKDEVISMFGGSEAHLAFASNAQFRGKEIFLNARGLSILDVIKLSVISLDSKGDSKELQEHFTRWADQNKKGDIAYLHENARLIMLRGARLARLKVKNWLDADRVTNDELRELINKDSRTEISVKDLPPMNGPMRLDTRIFIAVETAEKKLAVIALKNREFGSLIMRCRARGEMKGSNTIAYHFPQAYKLRSSQTVLAGAG